MREMGIWQSPRQVRGLWGHVEGTAQAGDPQ